MKISVQGFEIVDSRAWEPQVVLGTIALPFYQVLPTPTASLTTYNSLDEMLLFSSVRIGNRRWFVVRTSWELAVVVCVEGSQKGGMEGGEHVQMFR